jgi:hypothetical protein
VAHATVAALVWFVLVYNPEIGQPLSAEYTVRSLDLQLPKKAMRQMAGSRITYPIGKSRARAHSPAGGQEAPPRMLLQVVKAVRGPQTLLQPDIITHLIAKQKILVPRIVIWEAVKTPANKIIPPQPHVPVLANITPTLLAPNNAIHLDKVELAAVKLPAENLPVVASTTSPVKMHGPKPTHPVPSLTTQTTAPPTPAAVVSLSNLAMMNGPALLPPVNETVVKASPGGIEPSRAKGATGNGMQTGNAKGTGMGTTAGAPGKQAKANGTAGRKGSEGSQSGVLAGSSQNLVSPAAASGTGMELGAVHISLPKNGQFGAVIVGDALASEFPAVADVWGGRLAYTVYLHVGLSQNWILQYALPPLAAAAEGGVVPRLEAPWPYNIVRPNIPPGSVDASAVMVHGFVNAAGRFEDLAIAYPPKFPEAQFVLRSLQKWEFRPATENGQAAKVEVLLIIPAQFYSGSLKPLRAPVPGLLRTLGLAAPGLISGPRH